MHRMRKGQIQGIEKGHIKGQVKFISQILEWLHEQLPRSLMYPKIFCNRTVTAR
jgi:hypothetical protein